MNVRMCEGMVVAETAAVSGGHAGRRVRVTIADQQGGEYPIDALTGEYAENVVAIEIDGRTVLTLYVGNQDVFGAGTVVLELRRDELHEAHPLERTPSTFTVNDESDRHEDALKDAALLSAHREAFLSTCYVEPKIVGRWERPTEPEIQREEIRRRAKFDVDSKVRMALRDDQFQGQFEAAAPEHVTGITKAR